MNIDELRNYSSWIGKPAQSVYVSALASGGWKVIFPHRLPRWASKIRNYFNVVPTSLERLDGDASKLALKHVQRFSFLLDCHAVQTFNRNHRDYHLNPQGQLNPPPFQVPTGCPVTPDKEVVHTGLIDSIAVNNALSGQVYKDESHRLWYQMSAGATIYHYGSEPKVPSIEAAYVEKIKGQDDTPVFKLVSPDNTGGSNEIILNNQHGSEVVGTVKQKVDVRKILVTNPSHQGSYNYSETVWAGFAAHELRDIKPHVAGPAFYVNPTDPFVPLAARRFPTSDLQGKDLAGQV